MALALVWGDPKGVTLIGPDGHVCLSAPSRIIDLVKALLVGWDTDEESLFQSADITVAASDHDFSIDSVTSEPLRRTADPIDLINFLFLCLAYIYVGRQTNAFLLHGAAYAHRHKTSLVFGAKRSGKSALVFQQAVSGARIFADDMLVWRPRDNYFQALGIPMRMRRPIPETLRTEALNKQFVAGKRIAYSAGSEFDIAPVGMRFFPDEVFNLERDGQLTPIPLLSILDVLRERTISNRL